MMTFIMARERGGGGGGEYFLILFTDRKLPHFTPILVSLTTSFFINDNLKCKVQVNINKSVFLTISLFFFMPTDFRH